MNAHNLARAFAVAAFNLGTLVWNTAGAGGISLYEVGTADVALASAGYSARAQVPFALGGRGDVVGSFNNVGIVFFAANFNWRF